MLATLCRASTDWLVGAFVEPLSKAPYFLVSAHIEFRARGDDGHVSADSPNIDLRIDEWPCSPMRLFAGSERPIEFIRLEVIYRTSVAGELRVASWTGNDALLTPWWIRHPQLARPFTSTDRRCRIRKAEIDDVDVTQVVNMHAGINNDFMTGRINERVNPLEHVDRLREVGRHIRITYTNGDVVDFFTNDSKNED